MIICERCVNRQNCEYTPYDVECDTRFKDVVEGEIRITEIEVDNEN